MERNSREPGTVPPPSELEILEPILEREPAEGVNDEFPLFEVRGGVNHREVAGHRAHRAQLRTGGHPAVVLPVVWLQTPAHSTVYSELTASNSLPYSGSTRGLR